MNANSISAIYPLSPLQQGMLFRTLYTPESEAYVTQLVCTLRGDLDQAALRQVWRQVVERHDILRTAFVWEDVDEPLQVVGARVHLPWEEHDWRRLPRAEQQQRLEEYLTADRRRGFNLAHAPLMRLSLIGMSAQESVFVWTHHHLLLDGWSTSLLMKEVAELYQARRHGEQPQPSPPRPFGDYIAWLRRQDASEAESFWRKALAGVSVPTPLGVGRNSSARSDAGKNYGQREDRLPAAETTALYAVARRHRLTLNTLIQGAWALLLSRYSGADDVVFGSVVSGRPAELAGVETMVGMFINTLAVRVRVPPRAALAPWLQELQAEQAEARRYEYSSLVDVQGWAGIPGGATMFESVLVFANYPVEAAGENQGAQLEIRDMRLHERNDVPLTLDAAPGPELRPRVIYDSQRFDEETAGRILGHLKTVLVSIAAGLEGRLADVPILTAGEREELLSRACASLQCGPDQVLQQMFEAHAAADPAAPAISYDGHLLSYAELNGRSNQIAHGLRSLGVAAGRPMAVMLGDGPTHVAALFGALKAGCPFVCLDPNFPPGRVEQLLKEVEAAYLVTDANSLRLHARVVGMWQRERGGTVVSLDGGDDGMEARGLAEVVEAARWFEAFPETNPAIAAAPSDIVYLAFTSGSTGQPKGIMQTHRSFCQFLRWQSELFRIGPGNRVAHWAWLTYDASYGEIFGALCFGATLCMTTPAKRYDPAALVDWVREERISLLQMVPSFCWQVLETLDAKHASDANPWPDLEHMLLAGEVLSVDLARAWLGRFRGANQLCNLYGPSETVLATYYHVEEVDEAQRSIPIGQAIAGRQILILDEGGRLCPVGVAGEIYVRSPYLTSGYWRRPQETEQSFIQNPLHRDYPDPVYRTGDLGRWLPDGNAEFRGRRDQQVKIRGMRVEIEEIESALRRLDVVGEATVAARQYDDRDQRLVAYIVMRLRDGVEAYEGAGDVAEIEARLRSFLKELLPEHMIPAAFVFLDSLPRTSTGKLDRKALPRPELQRRTGRPFVAPRTTLESIIAGIWQDLLKVEGVGVEDNFFELGGHSILAMRAANRVREKCLTELPLPSFFESPTVAGVARYVEAARRESEEGPKMLRLLESVKQLSADEASALLRSKRKRL